jgi:hypothetical protein
MVVTVRIQPKMKGRARIWPETEALRSATLIWQETEAKALRSASRMGYSAW